jgi:hypothetical protein
MPSFIYKSQNFLYVFHHLDLHNDSIIKHTQHRNNSVWSSVCSTNRTSSSHCE